MARGKTTSPLAINRFHHLGGQSHSGTVSFQRLREAGIILRAIHALPRKQHIDRYTTTAGGNDALNQLPIGRSWPRPAVQPFTPGGGVRILQNPACLLQRSIIHGDDHHPCRRTAGPCPQCDLITDVFGPAAPQSGWPAAEATAEQAEQCDRDASSGPAGDGCHPRCCLGLGWSGHQKKRTGLGTLGRLGVIRI